MKKYNLIIVSIFAGALCLSSCKKFLDINKSPKNQRQTVKIKIFSFLTVFHRNEEGKKSTIN